MPDEPRPEPVKLDGLGYAAAVEELEEILAELDADDVDVDHLAERVRRAADLVALCRSRLDAARVEVTRIVADLEAVAPPASEGGSASDGSRTDPSPDEDPGGLFGPHG